MAVQALPRSFRLTPRGTDGGLLGAPILVLGAPRSGTTWLAKIVDSHPDVIYRHEPDSTVAPPPDLTEAGIPDLIRAWASEQGARTVTKQPFFVKSYQPRWAKVARTCICAAVSAAARLPGPLQALGRVRVPDLNQAPPPHLLIKSITWAEGAATMARALPHSRTILILRHPCAQVASVMRGNRQRRFDLRTAGTDMPFDEDRAIRYAARHDVDEPAFQALPDAAKYAWSWRAFNEPAHAALAHLPNARVVVYETLCAAAETGARAIFDFAGLGWQAQTAAFVGDSTSRKGAAGYYSIYRDAIAARDAWRSTMPPADADAVRATVAASPLARLWPDL